MKKNKRLNKAEKRRQRNYLKRCLKNTPDCIQSEISALAEELSQVAVACANTFIELAQRISGFFRNRS